MEVPWLPGHSIEAAATALEVAPEVDSDDAGNGDGDTDAAPTLQQPPPAAALRHFVSETRQVFVADINECNYDGPHAEFRQQCVRGVRAVVH
jgi:hypothetical protein